MAVHPAADSSGLPPRAPHSDTSDPVSASSSASVGAGGSGGPTVRTSSSSLDAIKERMERINLSVRQSSAGPRPATAPAPPAQAAMGNGDVSTAGVHAKGGEFWVTEEYLFGRASLWYLEMSFTHHTLKCICGIVLFEDPWRYLAMLRGDAMHAQSFTDVLSAGWLLNQQPQ